MLGIKGKIAATDEFQKANIISKTIRLRRDDTIKECMSFPHFDFIKLSRETDRLPLPDGRMMTKQCFRLNNTYIAEQIKDDYNELCDL